MYRQKRTLKKLAIIALILTLLTILAAAETIVSVDAPEYVLSNTFDVEIRIEDVYELDTGEFHLLFDPNVVDVTDVTAGDIGNMNVGFTNKRCDKNQGIGIIKVIFDISGSGGVSGSGSLVTISFKVIGKNGDCSLLRIFNPTPIYIISGFEEGALVPWKKDDKISANWVNGIVCIGDPADSSNTAKVPIFVENRDDDELFVELHIDGAYQTQKKIKKDVNMKYYEGRILTEGAHTFEIGWHDPDTDEDYVKTENHSVSDGTTITLMTDEHTKDNSTDLNSSTDKTSTPDTPKATVAIFVENRDDDELDVYLYIDGAFQDQYAIKKDQNKEFYGSRKLPEGVHTFEIRWYDPDTDEKYVKTEDHSVSGTTAVALMTDEHTEDDVDKLIAHVHVTNLDDDDPDVYLYIDGVYRKYKSISSGSTDNYGEYEFEEDEDALHSFRIEWLDPGTNETYEKIVRSYITTEEAVILYVDKHTEEDTILLSEETPTPVQARSTSTTTSTRSTGDSQPPSRNTPSSSVFRTDPTLSENSAGNNGSGPGITPLYTLIGFIAAGFALLQIRRS